MTTEQPTPPAADSGSAFPVNRVVAFLGPVIAIVAGTVADWLLVHVHVLGTFYDRDQVSRTVAQIVIFGLTAVLVWAGQAKWLSGWQRQAP